MQDHPNIVGDSLSLVIPMKEQWYFFVGQSIQNILKAFRLTLFCYFICRNLDKMRPSHFLKIKYIKCKTFGNLGRKTVYGLADKITWEDVQML